MDANLAFAPVQRLSSLYDTPGVDFFDSRYWGGDDIAEHVEWVEFAGTPEGFDEDAADEIIAAQGYKRTSPWSLDLEYGVAAIAKVETHSTDTEVTR